jgi:hypothetical protein
MARLTESGFTPSISAASFILYARRRGRSDLMFPVLRDVCMCPHYRSELRRYMCAGKMPGFLRDGVKRRSSSIALFARL